MELNKIGIILSSGRTGTQFFEDFINEHSKNSICLHEPRPTRRFRFYSNLLNDSKISQKFVRQQFVNSRKKLTKSHSDKYYIESNNFIYGCVPAISKDLELKILHIIRDPKTYIQSHLKHGYWHGLKKFMNKYAPYWYESKRSVEWKNDPVKLLALRWAFVNEKISGYTDNNDYLLIRFEDLFSKNIDVAKTCVKDIIDFFKLDMEISDDLFSSLNKRKNVGKKVSIDLKSSDIDEDFLLKHCGSLMKKYNYL